MQPRAATVGEPGGRTCAALVAGHGEIDDTVTAMLAQLIGEQSVAARRIAANHVTRDGIEALDLGGIEVIAISYLEITGSLAWLRYLVRRLRAKVPGARIVVGMWPLGEKALSDAGVQQALGVDRYVRR